MSDKSKSHITTDAVTPCIDSLNQYNEELKSFYDKTITSFTDLGDSHKDQNYERFEEYFNDFWPVIEQFRSEVERFNGYLVEKSDFIRNVYNEVSIKKPR